MDYAMDWHITIGKQQLMMLDSVEVHKSVDLLADTCKIKLPDAAYNRVLKINDKIKRGDKVTVLLGYNGALKEEFTGYLQTVSTDGGNVTLHCEDSLFLLRKKVANKQFLHTDIKTIANYLIQQVGVKMKVNATLPITYDKFVINMATAYDVLKKIAQDTKANIFIREGITPTLEIHPPYIDKGGEVGYSFQNNIETSSLKYVSAADKKILIIIKTTGKDGKTKEVRYGTTGGDQVTKETSGLGESAMQRVAEYEYNTRLYDGYEGSITGWLIPYCEPTYSATVLDEEYPEKNGIYYVVSVTTTFDKKGGVRKVQLGKKIADGHI